MVTFTMKTYLHWRRVFFFFQAEDGIRYADVTGVQTCALFFSSRRRHTRCGRDWSSDVCSSDLAKGKSSAVTRKRKLAAIRGFLKFLKDNQIIYGNPADTIEIGRASCRERV